ncbi:phosphatase PAP2 family protein [Zobellia roscoffensis]|uniref:phosphatase PAP2 family protein n=1 Tax=Zobellia roscoffensis TaxID=2779508 RepID=UPI00188CE070|nr:phosphatase PAP2 family protein [Zobellia roscoffensis]
MKIKIAVLLTFCTIGSLVAQVDSLQIRPKKKLFKKTIVPLSLLTAGILLSDSNFEKNLHETAQGWVGNDFRTHLDDYTRYAPVATIFVANVAGVKAKHHWFDQTKNLAVSMILTDVVTRAIKNSVYKIRPDGSNDNAFPSGHTSIAFASGSAVYEEYKNTNPYVAYSGYGFATITGGLRLFNNKHFISDILAGAGIGILVTKLVYHFDYLWKWNPFLKFKDVTLVPRYAPGNVGLYFSKSF